MSMPQYIYIDETGDIAIGTKPPTPADLECVDDGILAVIKISPASVSHGDSRPMTIEGIDCDDETYTLPAAILATPADDPGNPYHYVPSS